MDEVAGLEMMCLCGYVVRGEIEEELVANVRNHIDEAHPENAEVSDEEILASHRRQLEMKGKE